MCVMVVADFTISSSGSVTCKHKHLGLADAVKGLNLSKCGVF